MAERGSAIQQLIARKFAYRRVEAGISLKVMADSLGVALNTVMAHEAGQRCFRADMLVEAAAILGCDPRDLMLSAEEVPDYLKG